jgi:hypothetical protein
MLSFDEFAEFEIQAPDSPFRFDISGDYVVIDVPLLADVYGH